MAIDLDTQKKWLASLKLDSLLPNDPRCLDLHHYDYEGQQLALRGKDWIHTLRRVIRLAEGSTCQLFSGFRGTGKSTELLRLKAQLEQEDYNVLFIDMFDYHDLEHSLTVEDLVIILAAAIGDFAHKLDADTPAHEFWERLTGFLKSEVSLSEIKLGAKPIDLKFLVRSSPTIWSEVRSRLGTSLRSLVDAAHEFIRLKVGAIKKKQAGDVVVIFDSLEKLSGPETNFIDTMNSVIRVFSQYAPYLRLPDCHVIYTIPPYATFMDPQVEEHYDSSSCKPLPVIKIVEKGPEAKPYAAGYAALKELLDKRVPLATIFGDDMAPVERLVRYSGGHVRTLLRMMRDLLVENDTFPLGSEQVNLIIKQYQEKFARSIRPEGIPMLERIRQSFDLGSVREDELVLLARYMDHHLVLCYQNGEGWFQLHPLIQDDVQSRARAQSGDKD